ncbi:UPAR/Ly6 domain-containing protein crok [Bemisia tabaci]|uniref:UPAR/Ly6 domain-containing protein crok n=1 Tax=Bemisia tabaci TaxID=7038 RepID=UPI0008F9E026|nr:PREDICTED: uncharacterized protein LOC109042200 [Bemisia tabaci]
MNLESAQITLLLVLACVTSGLSIHCFECNSHNDTRCADEKPPDALKKDCSEHLEGSKYTMCRKITQTIEFEVNGLPPDNRVIRTCGWDESNYKNKCYQRSGFGGRQEVCSCSTDYCNAASTSHLAIGSCLVAVVSVLLKMTPLL